jgi:CheY-like chemotaxis protein
VAYEIRNIERREGKLRSRTPIVALTADGRAETYAKALDADIDALLEKPVRSHELLENAREAIDDRTAVLIVDADADRVRAFEKHCAELSKVRTIVASCSAEACQRLRRERIDLAVVHVVTEGLNGQGAARLLRTVAPPALPIIALLEGADEAARLRCVSNSFTECVAEPLRKAVVVAMLQSYGRGSSRRPPMRRPVSRPWSGAVVATIDEDDDVRALLPQFLNNLARDIEIVRKDLAQGLTESSVRIGHNFKGTGKSYGFPAISSVGARLEEAGYRGDVASARGCIELLVFELEQGRTKIS